MVDNVAYRCLGSVVYLETILWHMGYIADSHCCSVDRSGVSFVIFRFSTTVTFLVSRDAILIGLLQVQLVCHSLVFPSPSVYPSSFSLVFL